MDLSFAGDSEYLCSVPRVPHDFFERVDNGFHFGFPLSGFGDMIHDLIHSWLVPDFGGVGSYQGMPRMARRWAATNELEGSQGHCKPVAAETWVVPRPHQFERRLIVVEASRISRGVDVL